MARTAVTLPALFTRPGYPATVGTVTIAAVHPDAGDLVAVFTSSPAPWASGQRGGCFTLAEAQRLAPFAAVGDLHHDVVTIDAADADRPLTLSFTAWNTSTTNVALRLPGQLTCQAQARGSAFAGALQTVIDSITGDA